MNLEISKLNGSVAFNEEEHKYWNIKDPSKKYTSVTTLISKYHEEFNSEFFSKYKALEKLADEATFKKLKPKMLSNKVWNDSYRNLCDVSKEDLDRESELLLKEWDEINKEACDIGHSIHLERENEWYDGGQISKHFNLNGKFNCVKHNFDLKQEKAVMPEFLVYYSCPENILHLAGQVDLLIKDGNNLYILDYKSNKKGIETKAYFNPRTKQTKKMFYPINNLDDCMLIHYNLQLSIYAWMLKKINPEFNIRVLKLLHIDREKNETEFDVPFLQDDVTRLLAHYKKELKKSIK